PIVNLSVKWSGRRKVRQNLVEPNAQMLVEPLVGGILVAARDHLEQVSMLGGQVFGSPEMLGADEAQASLRTQHLVRVRQARTARRRHKRSMHREVRFHDGSPACSRIEAGERVDRIFYLVPALRMLCQATDRRALD